MPLHGTVLARSSNVRFPATISDNEHFLVWYPADHSGMLPTDRIGGLIQLLPESDPDPGVIASGLQTPVPWSY